MPTVAVTNDEIRSRLRGRGRDQPAWLNAHPAADATALPADVRDALLALSDAAQPAPGAIAAVIDPDNPSSARVRLYFEHLQAALRFAQARRNDSDRAYVIHRYDGGRAIYTPDGVVVHIDT